MELYYSGLSDRGNVRRKNEDYYFADKIKKDEYLFIIADGMGGHQAGEVASRSAVSRFVQLLEKRTGDDISGDLKRIILDVNECLVQEGSRTATRSGMGTTLSVFYVRGGEAYIAHVGDSRIYRYTNTRVDSKMEQLTEDHSFVGKLLKDGFITEEEARNHPRRNVLYQSVGLKRGINVQVNEPISLQKGQKYLLCTDGLYNAVPENEITEYLKGPSNTDIVRQLVKKAKANGGPDNISVIVVSTVRDKTTGADTDTHSDRDTLLEDTVKIPALAAGRRKKRKLSFFILLGLLVLLLAAIIYLLITAGSTNSQTLGDSGGDTGTGTVTGARETGREK